MKTKNTFGKRLLPILICAGMIFVGSAYAQPAGEPSAIKSTDHMTVGRIVRLVGSFFRQPHLSREAERNAPWDAIIVPGIPYKKDQDPGMIMKARVRWACRLYADGIAGNIIFSGGAVYSPYCEGQIMALYAIELGIPAEHVFCEAKAEHATENVIFSLQMADSLGFKKIALATGPFQSSFLEGFLKDHAPELGYIPIRLTYWDRKGHGQLPEIDASQAYTENFVPLGDRQSWSERMQGTLGNTINQDSIPE